MLELIDKVPADHDNGFLPVYKFKMMNTQNRTEMGGIPIMIRFIFDYGCKLHLNQQLIYKHLTPTYVPFRARIQ